MLDPATFRSRASFFVFRVVPSSSFSARSRLLFLARFLSLSFFFSFFFFFLFFFFFSLSSLSVSPSGYRRPGSPSFAVLISSTCLRPGGYLRKARILPSHGHCSDESRHCASKSKGVGVRFPCIPLHDRVSSSHPETKTRSIRFVYARKTANENKPRGEKAKKNLEKNLCRSWEESWENRCQPRKTFSKPLSTAYRLSRNDICFESLSPFLHVLCRYRCLSLGNVMP